MIERAILKINSNAVFTVRGRDIDTCEIEWLENTTPISKEDIKAQIPTVEAEIDNTKAQEEANKVSGNAKLLALGLSQEEATALTGYKPEE